MGYARFRHGHLAGVALVSVPEYAVDNFGRRHAVDLRSAAQAGFSAGYSGPNSLSPDRENGYSYTVTAFLGARPWKGGELYFNPELAAGAAFESDRAWRLREWRDRSCLRPATRNPAYNADRGPVSVGAVRVHAEF